MKINSFDKIEFPQDTKGLQTNRKSLFRPQLSKNRTILIIVVFFVLVLASFGIFLAIKTRRVYADVKASYAQARLAWDAAKKQNIVLAREELVKTQQKISLLNKDLNELGILNFIPILNLYYQDAQHVVSAASYGLSASITVADSLIPYADVLGLKGEKSFVQGSAEDRIKLAVKTMGKVVVKIDDIEKDLVRAKEEIDKVDPHRYPPIGALKKARAQLERIREISDQGIASIGEAKPLIKALPDLLGEPKSQKYLILFQNDKELRPTGGFITFYAILRIEEGVIHVDNASDIYDLDASIVSHPTAPPIIRKYLPKVPTFNIRDSNLSPDFVRSMEAFNSLYEKSSQKVEVDGIIALDTHVLVHTLDILGDITAAGLTFHSKTDPACNCPQVVYLLELNTTKPVGYIKENRKGILGELLFAIMKKALSSSPKLYWGRLFQQSVKDLSEKHILLSLHNQDAQKGVEALNFAGRIKEFEGDYLHINDANFAGAKSNMYVKQAVRIDYTIDNKGEISKKITIDYKNPYPHSDCDLESGGLCLNATLRDYLRLYVSKGSVLEEVKGSEVKVEESEELGKTMYAAFLTVKPLGKSQITFSYKLPFKTKNGSSLPVLIQKQPGTSDVSYEIYVSGSKKESFVLNEDKVLNLKL